MKRPLFILIKKYGNVLFNDALNTFYLRHRYGKRPLRLREWKPAAAAWTTFSD